MKHAVLGAGAVGGIMATALGFLGEDVTLIVRPARLSGYPQQISLQQPARTITANARPVDRLIGPTDVLWIATKTYQLDEALQSIEAQPKAVVPLLNGVDHMPVLRARFGNDAVYAGTISVEADRIAEGQFAQRGLLRLSVIETAEPLLGAIFAKLQDQLDFACRFVDNEATLLWTKLCFLAPFALLTAASGKDKGGIFADPGWKATLDCEVDEAVAVAKACGADVDVAVIKKVIDGAPPTMRASMLKDLIAGRQLELDAIGGPIVRGGEKYGISVSTTKKLISMIAAHAAAQRAQA